MAPPFVLESSHADFSLTNSLACARASLLAYSDEATAIATANDWGFDCVKALARGPNYAIVLCNRSDIVVAFRGTDAWNDWLTNLNILYKRSPLGSGFVHRGFMKATASFWPELQQHLVKIRDNDQRIVFTGHSLGGALALLASLKCHFDDGLPISGLYTFGQPPIGTVAFSLRFREQCPFRLYRFVNQTDAVAAAPIITLLDHVGEVRYFDTAGKLWEGDPPWRTRLLDQIRAPHLHGGLSQFGAHSMKDYVDLIARSLST
jgi:triacylglycerol lipase